jgi:hypothetical protein
MAQTTSADRYRGDRKPTNIILSAELVDLAQRYLPATKHRNLSRFTENALRALFRKEATKIRGAGLSVPESAFIK